MGRGMGSVLGYFGDRRLDAAGAFLLGRLIEIGGEAVRVRRLGGNRAGELRITRFLRNRSVTVGEIFSEAQARTVPRCLDRDILVVQDTTVVRSEGGGGTHLHVAMALDEQDASIKGLVDARFLWRDGGRRVLRRGLPIEEKESFRWLQAAEEAASVCAGARRITIIADRESDIFEAFALRPAGVDMLVRAAQDRSLEDDGRLFTTLDALPEAARAELELPAQPGRKRRVATLAVRFATMCLACPTRGFRDGLPDFLELNVVDVREVRAPQGEPPVHWRLLTTRQVKNVSEAWAVVDLYRKRWPIEQLFRTCKTQGFDIEGLRIEDAAPREKLVAATLVAALDIQQLVHARDGGPGPLRPVTDVFDPSDAKLLETYSKKLEGKTERQKNPHPKESLAYAAWVCARLGGWTGYYGKPGPIVMLRGWLEIQAAKRAMEMLSAAHDV